MIKQNIPIISSIILTDGLVYEQIKKNDKDLLRLFEKIAGAHMSVTFIASDINKLIVSLPFDKVSFQKTVFIKDGDASTNKKRDFKQVLREALETSGTEAFHTMLMSISEGDFKAADRLGIHFVLVSSRRTDKCQSLSNVSQVSLK